MSSQSLGLVSLKVCPNICGNIAYNTLISNPSSTHVSMIWKVLRDCKSASCYFWYKNYAKNMQTAQFKQLKIKKEQPDSEGK